MTLDTLISGLSLLTFVAVLFSAGMALRVRTPKWLFLAAFFSWIASFFALWSIGWLLLALPFIFVVLGIGRWLGKINHPLHVAIAIGVGALFWFVVVYWFRGPWIFWPWTMLLG